MSIISIVYCGEIYNVKVVASSAIPKLHIYRQFHAWLWHSLQIVWLAMRGCVLFAGTAFWSVPCL